MLGPQREQVVSKKTEPSRKQKTEYGWQDMVPKWGSGYDEVLLGLMEVMTGPVQNATKLEVDRQQIDYGIG